MLRLGLSSVNPRQFCQVNFKRAHQNDQFDDINPSLTTLGSRNKRLITVQPLRQLRLRQAGSFAGVFAMLIRILVRISANPITR